MVESEVLKFWREREKKEQMYFYQYILPQLKCYITSSYENFSKIVPKDE